MKFAYSTTIFRLRPLSEAIDGIARAGFCGVELIADRPHAFPEDLTAAQITGLNECLEQRKLKVCNLNSCVVTALGDSHNPSWIAEDWQMREKRINYTLSCLRMGAAMGIPCVSTNTGAEVIPQSMNRNDALRLYVGNMHRVLPLAQKLGLRLLIQPEPESLIQTTDQTLELLQELKDYQSLGISFDAGHFFCVGEDPCEAWEKLKPHVVHIHLDDIAATRAHRHIQLGDGAMDISNFLRCVQRGGYEGYVTIKLDSCDQRAEETVMGSARYLRAQGFLE